MSANECAGLQARIAGRLDRANEDEDSEDGGDMAATQTGKAGADEVSGAVLSQPLLGLTFDDVMLIPRYSEILPETRASRAASHGASH